MELLLCALSEALYHWRGHTAIRVELEGHGREDILPGLDVTRTVGWFTSKYPMVLEWRRGAGLEERIQRMKESVRRVPNRGIGYSVLRHLCPDSGLPGGGTLLVNYLGQLDSSMGSDVLLPRARERCADSASPGRSRGNSIEFNAMVIEGRFRMLWSYSSACYRDETIAALARGLERSLQEMIVHCRSACVDFTSADLADFNWGQSQLDSVAAAIARAGG